MAIVSRAAMGTIPAQNAYISMYNPGALHHASNEVKSMPGMLFDYAASRAA